MKKVLRSIMFLVLLSCKNETDTGVKPMNYSSIEDKDLQAEVYKGNIDAYHVLSNVYLDYPSEDFLFWALIMANRYDYGPAYMDVYYALKHGYEKGGAQFKDEDKLTEELMLKYLKLAAEKKVDGAKEELNCFPDCK